MLGREEVLVSIRGEGGAGFRILGVGESDVQVWGSGFRVKVTSEEQLHTQASLLLEMEVQREIQTNKRPSIRCNILGRSTARSVIRLTPKKLHCLCRTVFSLARSRESCCSPRCDGVGPEGLAKEGLGKKSLQGSTATHWLDPTSTRFWGLLQSLLGPHASSSKSLCGQVDAIFNAFDQNKDGGLSREEFEKANACTLT